MRSGGGTVRCCSLMSGSRIARCSGAIPLFKAHGMAGEKASSTLQINVTTICV